MKIHLRSLILFLSIGVSSVAIAKAAQNSPTLKEYAEPVTDDYFGTEITNPYRWMEAKPPNPHFVTFLKAQNQATQAALAKLSIPRSKLLTRIQSFDSPVAVTGYWLRARTS